MPATILASRRTTYEADDCFPMEGKPGWFFDAWGYEFFDGQADVELARAKLLLEMDLPPAPAVVAVEISGRWPRVETVRGIRVAVEAIPLHFRSRWLAAGGRIEVLPGVVLPEHPHWLGVNKFNSARARVAGDHPDAAQTARHEFAHGLDFALGYPSHSEAWLQIWRADVAAGKVPGDANQDKPEEFFAEQFARLWHPELYPTQAAQEFIMGLV